MRIYIIYMIDASSVRCAVCIILRFNPAIKDHQILLCVRTVNANDRHSGQVCMPGGKCEGGETDQEACIREVREETGLHIDDSSMYECIGMINSGMHAYSTIDKRTVLTTFAYRQKVHEEVILNEKEMSEYWWEDLGTFFSYDPSDFFPMDLPRDHSSSILLSKEPSLSKFFSDSKSKMKLTCWFLRMKNNPALLWGLTLMMLCSFLQYWSTIVSLSPLEQFKMNFLIRTTLTPYFECDDPHLYQYIRYAYDVKNDTFRYKQIQKL